MCSLKLVVVFVALVAVSNAIKTVTVQNGRATDVILNVAGTEQTVLAGGTGVVVLNDDFSDSITATPSDAEVTDGPKTNVKLSLGAIDTYCVSLSNGFNVGIKIIPVGSANCTSSLCLANINAVCSPANQVLNSVGTVVGCKNDPIVMARVCPLAQVNEADVTAVQSCATAISYMIILN